MPNTKQQQAVRIANPTPDSVRSWSGEDIRAFFLPLLKQQIRRSFEAITEECRRWEVDFISDDGTDYNTAALDTVAALQHLCYEGDWSDALYFLFAIEERYTIPWRTASEPQGTRELGPTVGVTLSDLNCGSSALVPQLQEFADRIDD